MRDIIDYLQRMFVAIFLCPVAGAFWLMFGSAGFSPDKFMQALVAMGQNYAAMGAESKTEFLFQLLFGWAALAFVFMLISFVSNPPRFGYILKKKGGKPAVSVLEKSGLTPEGK